MDIVLEKGYLTKNMVDRIKQYKEEKEIQDIFPLFFKRAIEKEENWDGELAKLIMQALNILNNELTARDREVLISYCEGVKKRKEATTQGVKSIYDVNKLEEIASVVGYEITEEETKEQKKDIDELTILELITYHEQFTDEEIMNHLEERKCAFDNEKTRERVKEDARLVRLIVELEIKKREKYTFFEPVIEKMEQNEWEDEYMAIYKERMPERFAYIQKIFEAKKAFNQLPKNQKKKELIRFFLQYKKELQETIIQNLEKETETVQLNDSFCFAREMHYTTLKTLSKGEYEFEYPFIEVFAKQEWGIKELIMDYAYLLSDITSMYDFDREHSGIPIEEIKDFLAFLEYLEEKDIEKYGAFSLRDKIIEISVIFKMKEKEFSLEEILSVYKKTNYGNFYCDIIELLSEFNFDYKDIQTAKMVLSMLPGVMDKYDYIEEFFPEVYKEIRELTENRDMKEVIAIAMIYFENEG